MVDGAQTPSGSHGNAGWHPDPARRFELRYHNGRAWTADVSTDGERFVDPAGARPAATPAPPIEAGPTETPHGRNPIATASMVLGIVAICIGWMPFVVGLGVITATLGIAFGITGRRRAVSAGAGGGFALTGIITGAVGLVVCIGGVLFSISLLRAVDSFENPAANETAINSCERDGDQLTARGSVTNTSGSTASYTIRVFFVRPGTDNPRRQSTIIIDPLPAGETATFETSRNVGELDLDCIVGAVRGPLPYGVDPGT
jgi:hypothetical protein